MRDTALPEIGWRIGAALQRGAIRSRQARDLARRLDGHRQPQPDARHCERRDHGNGDSQADGRALLR
ncbi:MAG TPA: hypothetical protein VN961_14920 [Streptosporangiaceae bacterium]|nr:hypothetical protein [Streptosporangiaceae bacterium]